MGGFIGRVSVLADVARFVGEAAARRGGLQLIAGEPGIGKTSLVSELDHAVKPGLTTATPPIRARSRQRRAKRACACPPPTYSQCHASERTVRLNPNLAAWPLSHS